MVVNNNEKKIWGIDGFYLKLIAVVTMIIDHIGMVLFPSEMAFRIIGRIAFPIYCFLVVEGFFHTSNVKRYITRLTIFALISEVPFDLLISGKLFDIYSQNVFFTLLIGLLTIYGIQRVFNPVMKYIILVAGMLLAAVLMTDYSIYGIVVIYIFCDMRDRRGYACFLMAIMSLLVNKIQLAAAFAIFPIMFYSGKKGPKLANNKLCQYGFYLIYPVHMLILYIIKLS